MNDCKKKYQVYKKVCNKAPYDFEFKDITKLSLKELLAYSKNLNRFLYYTQECGEMREKYKKECVEEENWDYGHDKIIKTTWELYDTLYSHLEDVNYHIYEHYKEKEAELYLNSIKYTNKDKDKTSELKKNKKKKIKQPNKKEDKKTIFFPEEYINEIKTIEKQEDIYKQTEDKLFTNFLHKIKLYDTAYNIKDEPSINLTFSRFIEMKTGKKYNDIEIDDIKDLSISDKDLAWIVESIAVLNTCYVGKNIKNNHILLKAKYEKYIINIIVSPYKLISNIDEFLLGCEVIDTYKIFNKIGDLYKDGDIVNIGPTKQSNKILKNLNLNIDFHIKSMSEYQKEMYIKTKVFILTAIKKNKNYTIKEFYTN